MLGLSSREWVNELEKAKEMLRSLRRGDDSGVRISDLSKSLQQLNSSLTRMEQDPGAFSVTSRELGQRRFDLTNVENAHNDLRLRGTANTPAFGVSSKKVREADGLDAHQTLELQRELISRQDVALEDIERGVGNLGNMGKTIYDEATLHNRLLNEIDTDVDATNEQLRREAERAIELRQSNNICSMYMCIALLVVLLMVMIILG